MKFIFALFCLLALVFANVQAVEKSACNLPKEVGPCRKAVYSFYYNADAKQCENFIYGGCMGNENRFENKADCEKLCVN